MTGYGGARAGITPLVSLIKTLRQIKADVPVYFIAGGRRPDPVSTTRRKPPGAGEEWVAGGAGSWAARIWIGP
jgi:hypothetical protein